MNYKLDKAFYTQPDVVSISKQLLGKCLVTHIDNQICKGIIVETEAYCGATDKACHAHLNRRTKRTEIMFQEGGKAYVYLCYGIHSLFNIVTNTEGNADAVLIRAVEPIEGIEAMLQRRKMTKANTRLTAGPGVMSKALGISTHHYGTALTGNQIWIEDQGTVISENEIIASPRVGIDYAEEDALLPWRFRIKGNKWTSPAK
jgi:DNA-3-methyladenine glycosylase